MKKQLLLILILFLISANIYAVNPYSQFGCNAKELQTEQEKLRTYTIETDKTKNNRQVHKIVFDHNNQGYIIYNSKNEIIKHGRIDNKIAMRWLSIDPEMKKYPNLSPYNAFENNPIYFNDPDGKDARVTIKGNNITIKANISIYGSGTSKAKAVQISNQIMKDWNNNGEGWQYTDKESKKQYNVKFEVNVSLYDETNPTNAPFILDKYNPLSRENYIDVTNQKFRAIVDGGDEGTWEANPSPEFGGDGQWSHEFGHLIGLDDRYDNILDPGTRKAVASKSHSGWEGNIMSGKTNSNGIIIGPGKVDQRNIDALVSPFATEHQRLQNANHHITTEDKKEQEYNFEINEDEPKR